MEALESVLFGIEPLAALVLGVGAILLAPIVGAAGIAVAKQSQEGSDETGTDPVSQAVHSASDSARDFAKEALVWGLEIVEGVQTSFAEANESFQDFVAEAKAEHEAKKAERQATEAAAQPHKIEIVSD